MTNQVKLHHRYNSFIAHARIHELKRARLISRCLTVVFLIRKVSGSDLKEIVKSRSRILNEGHGVSNFTILYP